MRLSDAFFRKTGLAVFLSLAAMMPAAAGELGPKRLAEALRAQPDETYHFVVTFRDGTVPDPALGQRADATALTLLNGFALPLTVAEAFTLAETPGVEWVWYLHPAEAPVAIRVLQSIDYTASVMDGPGLLNLSLGPPSQLYRTDTDPDAPIQRATGRAADLGLIPVIAIGNSGAQAPGFVNPWSTPPWVISVGAWDPAKDAIWEHSSTARPDQPESWPDLVAAGVDVIGPWPTDQEKPADRRAYDEANPAFLAMIAPQDRDKHTLRSGTSMATGVTSGAAAQVLQFLSGLVEEVQPAVGDQILELELGPEHLSEHDQQVARLTGTARPREGGGMIYTYTYDEPWKMVKQILLDTAIPVPGAAPWQAGAGRVDPDAIRERFGAYGIVKPQILPLKVL